MGNVRGDMEYDVFISHASEDKLDIATPLAHSLRTRGLRVWFDEFELTIGDSLRRKIDHGLSSSRFGVVILSPSFLHKEWPNKELDGLVARDDGQTKVILPIWHNVDANDIANYSPTLADKLSVSTSRGLAYVADTIVSVVKKVDEKPSKEKYISNSAMTELEMYPTLQTYISALLNYCSKLPYITLHNVIPSQKLGELYVPVKAISAKDSPSDALPLTIADSLQREQRLLFSGAPGSGKSTMLRQLAENAWHHPEKIGLDEPHIPILIPLRQLVNTSGSLQSRFIEAVTSELFLQQDLPKDFFQQCHIKTGRSWLILLDALDEVPSVHRLQTVQWIQDLSENIGTHRLIITSRPSGLNYSDFSDQFSSYKLLPFSSKQIDNFSQKWFGEDWKTFREGVSNLHISELAGTPLLLAVAAKVFIETKLFPEQISSLYNNFVRIWLSEANQKQLNVELGESLYGNIDMHLERLSYLAMSMTINVDSTSFPDLCRYMTSYFQEQEAMAPSRARAFSSQYLETMKRRSGVWVQRGETYSFVHKSFQEYLTACRILIEYGSDQEILWKRAFRRYEETQWAEVIFFTFDILNEQSTDCDELLRRILTDNRRGLLFGLSIVHRLHLVVHERKLQELVSLSEALVKRVKRLYHSGLMWNKDLNLIQFIREFDSAGCRELLIDVFSGLARHGMSTVGYAGITEDYHVRNRATAALLAMQERELAIAGWKATSWEASEEGFTEALVSIEIVQDLWIAEAVEGLEIVAEEKDIRSLEAKYIAIQALAALNQFDIIVRIGREVTINGQVRACAAHHLRHSEYKEDSRSILLSVIEQDTLEDFAYLACAKTLTELGETEIAIQIGKTLLKKELDNSLKREEVTQFLKDM